MKPSRGAAILILSLLPCLGVLLAWVGTFRHPRVASYPRGDTAVYFLASHAGKLELGAQRISPAVIGPSLTPDIRTYGRVAILKDGNTATAMSFTPHHAQDRFIGFGKSRYRGRFSMGATAYAAEARLYFVPYWALLVLLAVAPVTLGWLRYRRYRRSRRGLCPGCGYDLRASEGRCPECGAVARKGVR